MNKAVYSALAAALVLAFAPQVSAAEEKAAPADQEVSVIYGQVVSLQPEEQALVVATEENKKGVVIKVVRETTIWADYDKVDYARIAPQDYVEIEYSGAEGDYQANWIEIYRNTQ